MWTVSPSVCAAFAGGCTEVWLTVKQSDQYIQISFQISRFLFIVLIPWTEDGYFFFLPDGFFLLCVFLFIKSQMIMLFLICHCRGVVLRKEMKQSRCKNKMSVCVNQFRLHGVKCIEPCKQLTHFRNHNFLRSGRSRRMYSVY